VHTSPARKALTAAVSGRARSVPGTIDAGVVAKRACPPTDTRTLASIATAVARTLHFFSCKAIHNLALPAPSNSNANEILLGNERECPCSSGPISQLLSSRAKRCRRPVGDVRIDFGVGAIAVRAFGVETYTSFFGPPANTVGIIHHMRQHSLANSRTVEVPDLHVSNCQRPRLHYRLLTLCPAAY